MIFTRSALRETALTSLGVGFAFMALLLSLQVAKLLGSPTTGSLPFLDVGLMLLFNLARYLPLAAVLTVFIAVLTVMLRNYREQEMAVWLASGVSLSRWYQPMLTFAAAVALMIGFYSVWLLPQVEKFRIDFQNELKHRDELSMITPGLFIEPSSGDRVFFVEELSADINQARNVFVHSRSGERDIVVQAARAEQVSQEGEQRQLRLDHGIRFEHNPESGIRRLMRFESLNLWLPEIPQNGRDSSWRIASIVELVSNPDPGARGELAWRLGLPLAVFMVALLAVPLAYHNPRGGRSFSIVAALLIFAIYNNAIGIVGNNIEKGKLSLWLGMLLTHGSMGLTGLLLMAWRTGQFRPRCRR